MEPLDRKLVLDVGCGPAVLLSEISGRIKLGIGIDISQSIFPKTKQGMELAQADVCSLPFIDACFDKVVAMELVEHLYPRWATKMLKEISRILKDDGRFIVTTPHRKGLPGLLLAPLFKAISFIYCLLTLGVKKCWASHLESYKGASKRYGIKEHIKEYERKELFSLIAEAGFVVYSWSGSTISPYLCPSLSMFLRPNEFSPRFFRFWKTLNNLLTKYAAESFYWDIIVICGKAHKTQSKRINQ